MVDIADHLITFTQEGDFEAYDAAKSWCIANGYSCGFMQNPEPTGLLKGQWIIAKWRNLNKKQRDELDGTMSCVTSFREAPIHVVIKEKAQS